LGKGGESKRLHGNDNASKNKAFDRDTHPQEEKKKKKRKQRGREKV
jgi:hypothetical protein